MPTEATQTKPSRRQEAAAAIEQLVREFSADDVKDWLAEACTVMSGESRREGFPELAREWMHLGNNIAAIRNVGL